MGDTKLLEGKRAVLWAVLLLLGLHAVQPYFPFPNADDYAYAPLTELWRNPALYPGDLQIRSFANHAWAYSLAYLAAKATLGVAPGFWVLTVLFVVAGGLALFALLRRLGGTLAGFPLVLAATGLLYIQGIGRAEYGGFLSPFYHHQAVALCLVAWSFVLLLDKRLVWAGMFLGLAAYAQPMSALHGAFAAGLAVLFSGQDIVRRGAILAGSAIAVALPLGLLILQSPIGAPSPETGVSAADMVEGAYLFRAPHHYAMTGFSIALGWAWMAIAALSLIVLRHSALARPLVGIMAGFSLLLLAGTLGHYLWQSHFLPLYVLDVLRTSSLGFALAATLFAAAFSTTWGSSPRSDPAGRIAFWLAALLLAAIFALCGGPIAGVVAALSLLALIVPALAVPLTVFLAAFGLFLFAANAPGRTEPARLPPDEARMYRWIQDNTPSDALFVAPPSNKGLRYHARRGVYADFKMFSVAQPRQAWLTRERLERIAQPNAAERKLAGWDGIAQWDTAYARNVADCAGIARLLAETRADYLLRPAPAPACEPGLIRVYRNPSYAIYRPRDAR